MVWVAPSPCRVPSDASLAFYREVGLGLTSAGESGMIGFEMNSEAFNEKFTSPRLSSAETQQVASHPDFAQRGDVFSGSNEMNYSEKLKDPRWQRKRLEIMERDGFKCVRCGNGEKTLNVHHLAYKWKLKPWEYPNNWLQTLCEPCHECLHESASFLLVGIGCDADLAYSISSVLLSDHESGKEAIRALCRAVYHAKVQGFELSQSV